MANVKLKNINKIYYSSKKKSFHAVYDFSLDIKNKEFIVFVGPSGCGKSTTLRMIAGLEEITSGELFIDDKFCNYTHPKDRDIAMVFQSYALYPHMSVYDNLAFGLKIRKIPVPRLDKAGNPIKAIDKNQISKVRNEIRQWDRELSKLNPEFDNYESTKEEMEKLKKSCEDKLAFLEANEVQMYKYVHMKKDEIKERVMYAANILQITDYLERKPKELSGGQRQRVALGRAIVRKPKVFLMDEPLSNLDAKLRVQMRSEIVKLHKEVGATTIYVTHDQTEAMTMADRIVVLKDGYIQQIGTPREIYSNPANMFVGGFTGAPSMNFINCTYSKGTVSFGDKLETVKLPKEKAKIIDDYLKSLDHEIELSFGIRPEDIKVGDTGYEVIVSVSEMLGNEFVLHFDFAESDVLVKFNTKSDYLAGDKIHIEFDMDSSHIFDKESGKRII